MATWVIREDRGTWQVSDGRISQGFPTEGEALDHVRRHRRRGDKVVMEEYDGYRIPIRPRRHWRG